MTGSVFEHLPELKQVNLEHNKCIDQDFQTEEEIRGLSKILNATCGFEKNGNQIACETLKSLSPRVTNLLICELSSYTIVRDITCTISDPFNDQVESMFLSGNQNIEFLPISPHQIFPNIKFYQAARCAIKEISRRNFEGLVQLWQIDLQENQIYAVLSDTFVGLVELKWMHLSKFKLKGLTLVSSFLIRYKFSRQEQNQVHER